VKTTRTVPIVALSKTVPGVREREHVWMQGVIRDLLCVMLVTHVMDVYVVNGLVMPIVIKVQHVHHRD